MTAINSLLDKARERCSLPSDNALAQRMGVSRQLLSGWRKGDTPVSDDRIAQLALLAHVEPGDWLVQIHADQATGPAAKAWAALAKRLSAAAAVLLMLGGFSPSPAVAQVADSAGVSGPLYIMSIARMVRREISQRVRDLLRLPVPFAAVPA